MLSRGLGRAENAAARSVGCSFAKPTQTDRERERERERSFLKRIKDSTLRAGASAARAQSRSTLLLCKDLNESRGEKEEPRRRELGGLFGRCEMHPPPTNVPSFESSASPDAGYRALNVAHLVSTMNFPSDI